jgi:outer membrane protein OmpA-like peptidoglycan-associated protein
MRKNWLFLILATILVTVHYEAKAQAKNKAKYRSGANDPIRRESDPALMSHADALFIDGSFFNAIDYYQQLKQHGERDPYLTYQLAECYRFTRDYVPAAHYYQEVYNLAPKLYKLAIYYAGLMLKQQAEYDAAIVAFNTFLEDNKKTVRGELQLDQKTLKMLKKAIKVEIAGCEMAKMSIKNPEAVTMVNAGPNVNTIYTELSPYPLGDSSLLFSTIGRNDQIETDRHSVSPAKEHFMISHKQAGYVDSFQWPLPFNDGDFHDDQAHVGNGCYGPGGETFYYSKCREDVADSMEMRCKLFYSKFRVKDDNGKPLPRIGWQPSVMIPIEQKPEASYTMPWVAKVGKKEILFFASDVKLQSRGGFDIWYSVIDPRNGSFRRAQNAGKQINTTMDEVSPYYDPREQKLYFATSGLQSMGGFDIYSAEGGPTRYKNLHNLGYPINTSADEYYYVKDKVGKPDAYVVSNRIGSFALKNPTCCNDIWRIQVEPKLVVIGRVLSKRTQELVPQDVVKMVDQKGEMNTYNSEDGTFLFNMARGHAYVITADKPGYTSSRASVSTMEIRRSDPDDTVQVTIYLDSIRNSFSVSNIFYDYDKSTLRPESVAALDSVVNFLKDNPSISVEIYSYTDAKGGDDYNLALSQRRAQSVLDYLEKNGVERGRLTARGFGSKNPVAPNAVNKKDNPEGRQLNRRTEFRVVTDLPTRRVLYNSALPGSMDQQERNLRVQPEEDDEPKTNGKPAPVNEEE